MLSQESDRDTEARLFHEGIALFNEGEWFEAHEVWEDIWRLATGERKRFYQGLIQCAVTIEHVRRGNPRGVQSVFSTAVPKFKGLPEVYMGLHVSRLVEAIRQWVQPVLDLPREKFEPGLGRGLKLPVDFDAVPKIALEYDPFAAGQER